MAGGWLLRAPFAHAAGPIKMGIATDITGAIAPSGNANWQVAQFTVEQINKGGGILGRPIELYLEDTASDPKIAVGNVRKLIQERKVDVVLGGITSAMRQAIKDPIVNRGRTLYIYPQLYEGQECTKYLYCTGPTPAQQCDELIPYLIKTLGKKRFAMPSANYVWPQLLNKYARKVIEANGGEVVFEEYYPLDQAEYSATIGKIRDGKVDCVFNTVIPPGLQPFVKQLYEFGFQKNGGVLSCVYYDENLLNYHPAQEMEGLLQLPRLLPGGQRSVQQEAAGGLLEEIPRHQVPVHRRQRGDRHVSRHEVLRGRRQGDQRRPQARGGGGRDGHAPSSAEGPGGGAEMVPGKMHCKMNMYIAVCKVDAGKTRYDVIEKANMVDPKEC